MNKSFEYNFYILPCGVLLFLYKLLIDVSPIKVARVYEGFMMVNKDGFISENKTPVHPLAKYLVFEMPNLSAKENFGLEKQAPCKYTKKYLLVLYVTPAIQPASQPHLN
jgi:hypothetical protein